MEYRIGTDVKIKEQGETMELTCPNCNKKVNFSVFSNKKTTLVPKFPIVKSGNVFFLVCPECSKVYGVNDKQGKSFKKGEKLSIGNYDLFELEEFRTK